MSCGSAGFGPGWALARAGQANSMMASERRIVWGIARPSVEIPATTRHSLLCYSQIIHPRSASVCSQAGLGRIRFQRRSNRIRSGSVPIPASNVASVSLRGSSNTNRDDSFPKDSERSSACLAYLTSARADLPVTVEIRHQRRDFPRLESEVRHGPLARLARRRRRLREEATDVGDVEFLSV